MISFEGILKKYGKETVLKNVAASLPTEKIIAFIGGNGAGKSTLLGIISRLLDPNAGSVCIDGRMINQWNCRELAKHLTILGQSPNSAARITVEELVSFGRFPHTNGTLSEEDMRIVGEALDMTGMQPFKNRFIDELSGGQRQMAYIAMAIAQDTKYILLDEPLNNLDMSRAAGIMKILRRLVKEKSKTVMIVIHDINFVSFYADYIVALKDGELRYMGDADSIIRPEILSDIFSTDISVEKFGDRKICIYY